MKILWIVNEFFPVVSKKLDKPHSLYGGWTFGLAERLKTEKNIELSVVTADLDCELDDYKEENIRYFVLKSSKPKTQYDARLEPQWNKLIAKIKPDVVHIHGTEFAHGLALMKNNTELNYIISIQGLVSIYSKYFYGGITLKDILKTATIRDWLRWDTLIQGRNRYKKRGKNEVEYIKSTNAVMGRTDWDFAHTKAINPAVNYYFGNETLRYEFYTAKKWEPTKLDNHIIFLSQASNPLKGLQQVIKALPAIKIDFPNIAVRIAGGNILNRSTLKKRVLFTGFGNYIYKLAKKLDVLDNITFIGSLTANQMIEEYQNASLFVCPSSIENSPNSVGEAQIIGTPCVASYVGGNHNLITHDESGLLYRFEEYNLLAFSVVKLLKNKKMAKVLSSNGQKVASLRHNPEVNITQLLATYKDIKEKTE
jgi:glycosyltransferase involved in cell wall biosynthesis